MTTIYLLLRQVHPEFVISGKLSCQAFYPFPKDEGKLSVYDGKLISPMQSFDHYTIIQKLKSIGVWGVSNIEVKDTELSDQPDPLPNSPVHAYINFTAHSSKDYRKLSKKLKEYAMQRGCLYSSI